MLWYDQSNETSLTLRTHSTIYKVSQKFVPLISWAKHAKTFDQNFILYMKFQYM